MSFPYDELSERKKLILKAIIDAHIENGEPVGSKYITTNKQIAYSSATIRNEMAELESLGYLEQPHTSAGRVPSELGYRFYVDTMLNDYAMTATEINELNTLMKVKLGELDKILDKASKIASALTNYTGIAIKPKRKMTVIVKYEAVRIDERSFVLVMLTSAQAVKTKYVNLGFEVPPHVLSTLQEALNSTLVNVTAEDITLPTIMHLEEEMGDYSFMISPIIKLIYEAMSEVGGGELKVDGVDRLLQYPEYSDLGRFKALLGSFEKKDDILDVVSASENDGVNIYIGSENPIGAFGNSTLIYKTIKAGDRVVGSIGIIGPCRMDCSRVVAMIQHIADNISDMINDNNALPKGDNKDE